MKKTAKMRYVDMRLGDIRIPANYPRTDNTGDMLLALSICEQGNITPIIVDAKGFLISGKRPLSKDMWSGGDMHSFQKIQISPLTSNSMPLTLLPTIIVLLSYGQNSTGGLQRRPKRLVLL